MRFRIPVLAIIAILIASACGGSATPGAAGTSPAATTAAATTAAAATQGPPTKVTIMVGGLNKQIYLPNKLTEALGYFKEQNLTVDLIDEPDGTSTTTEVAAGNVDMGSGSFEHTVNLQAAGKTITAVVVFLQEPGEFVLVSAKKAETVKSAKDWKGLSAGVTGIGSGTHTLMRAIANKAGLADSDVSYVKASAGDAFIAAMRQDQIQVGITTQPTALRVIQQGVGKLLIDLSKPETTREALGGDWPFISLWAREDWIAKNKATTQKVVNAYVKTIKWINSHTAAEVADKLPADYYAGDKASYIQALNDSYKMFTTDGRLPKGAAEFVATTLAKFDDKVKAAKIDLTKTWTSEYVDNAK
jgi:NitT/TauT family transport system substrate-binding protein